MQLADFGLSQHVDKKHRDAGNVYYMAPEVGECGGGSMRWADQRTVKSFCTCDFVIHSKRICALMLCMHVHTSGVGGDKRVFCGDGHC